jgi:hypothetical protein
MTPDRLKERLSEIPIPPAAPAREQAVAEARAEIAERDTHAEAARGGIGGARRVGIGRALRQRRPRLVSLAGAVLLVIVVLLTPPGRAASAWVGELVGIGDVGGPPTEEKRGGFADADTAVVIDNGVAPDGSRYEWVAFKCNVDLTDEGLGTKFKGIGVSLDWPGVKPYEGGGSCEETEGRPQPGVLSQHGVHVVPSQMKGVAEPDLVVSGTTGPDVHRVSVIYRDGEGNEHELPVDFARVEGKLRELASRPEPLGTFVAFLPGEWAARDEVESRLDLRALFGTGKLKLGPIGRREREQARQAFETCDSLEPDPASLPNPRDEKAVEREFQPMVECHKRHMPPGPFEYVAYDESGRELERMTEPLIPAMVRPPSSIEAEGREEPGDRRARRSAETGSSGAHVMMTGRAPDGALFEFYIEQSKYGTCMSIWWPYGLGHGMGACGKELPPSTAYGRRNPEQVFAKPYGFLNEAPEATTSRFVSGFARTNVARVRVAYRDRDGARHDAPVHLVQVTASMLRKIESSEPFGYWIAFVPRSAGHRPIEVTAYAANGDRLGAPFTLQRP